MYLCVQEVLPPNGRSQSDQVQSIYKVVPTTTKDAEYDGDQRYYLRRDQGLPVRKGESEEVADEGIGRPRTMRKDRK